MNNLEINRHLLKGDIHSTGVLPHVEQLDRLPFLFEQEFGLHELPVDPGIIMVRGPRQYGKSTWLEQQIKITIESFGPGSALYLNGDEIADSKALLDNLRDLIHLFPNTQKNKRIFIDEITAISNWQKAIKRLADAGELKDILVVTTGSKATDLRRGFEMLPGRKGNLDRTNYIFTPISYKEFHNKCAATFGDDTSFAYILSGGSAIGANSLASNGKIAEYVVNTISDWVHGEFAQTGRSRAHVMTVLSMLYKFAANPVGQAKLARESDLANNTVANGYVSLFSDLMILFPAYQYDSQKQVSIFRKPCKYHFTNLFFAMCMHPAKPRTIEELKSFSSEMLAPVLEWVVAQEIYRQGCIANINIDFLNFWQTNDHEIDFVIPEKDLYIEVKSGHYQATNFLWFTKHFFGGEKLIVVNKDVFDSKIVNGIRLQDFLLLDLYA